MHSPWPLHTAVLDLDDTLYPEREFVLSGFLAVDAWLRASHGIHGFETEACRLFAAGHRGRIFDEALDCLGLSASAELVAAMLKVYRDHRPNLRLFPDAEELLNWAPSVGLRLALITDGVASVQRRKVTALGLESRISCTVFTDELGGRSFWKPHQAAFLRVMTAYPGPPRGYVYVADNPRKDFIAPRALGWRTLRIRRSECEHSSYDGSQEDTAEREIATLRELRHVFVGSPS
jgi:putative hydrolase of the HAD superfamily